MDQGNQKGVSETDSGGIIEMKPAGGFFRRFLGFLSGKQPWERHRNPDIRFAADQEEASVPNDIAGITEALRTGEYHRLPELYRVLSSRIENDRMAALGILKTILSPPSAGLWKMDSLCRAKTSLEWAYDWADVSPESLLPKDIADSEKVWIYGFASFHPNGYFRERATAALAGDGSGDALPFLILRLNDWVEAIGDKARQAVEARIAPAFATRFLDQLPLLKRQGKAGRASHPGILDKVTALIASDRNVLNRGLAAAEPDTRRFSFEIAAKSPDFEWGDIQDAILREPAGPIRLHALRSVENRLSFPRDGAFIGKLLQDRFTPVQRIALDILCSRTDGNTKDILVEKCLSEYAGLRQTARYYLEKIPGADPAEIYRAALTGSKGGALLGAIRGIGEVGEKRDAVSLEGFLTGQSMKVLKSSIRGLAALKPDNLPDLLLPYVLDPRPGVSRDAASAVRDYWAEIDLDRLDEAGRDSQAMHVRINVLKILLSTDPWVSLPFILEACGSENLAIREMARKGLDRWLLESNRYFIPPSDAQKRKAKTYFSEYSRHLDGRMRDVLEFILR